MLSSQQPPTQISSHAQLLEIFIEVDKRGGVDVDVDVLSGLRRAKEESSDQICDLVLLLLHGESLEMSLHVCVHIVLMLCPCLLCPFVCPCLCVHKPPLGESISNHSSHTGHHFLSIGEDDIFGWPQL